MTNVVQYIHGVEKVKLTEMHYEDFKSLRVTVVGKDVNFEITLFTDNGLPAPFEFGYNYMEKKDESEKV